jgi:hypothetical protein
LPAPAFLGRHPKPSLFIHRLKNLKVNKNDISSVVIIFSDSDAVTFCSGTTTPPAQYHLCDNSPVPAQNMMEPRRYGIFNAGS